LDISRRMRVRNREAQGDRVVTPARAATAAVAMLATLLVPEVSAAVPVQNPQEEQEQVRERQGEVALEIDVLEAEAAEVAATLATLEANVATQQGELASAEDAAATAATELETAEAEVAEAQSQVDALNAAADQLAIDAFVAPPAYNQMDALQADTLSEAAVMKALIDLQAETDAEVLDELENAQADLEQARDEKADVAAAAEEARAAEEGELAQVEAARAQQAQFAADAQAALDHKLTESYMLGAAEADLQAEIDALAEQLEASGVDPAAGSTSVLGDVTVTTVSCPSGGTITVAESIGSSVQQLLDAASADGVSLCGWGYRSSDAQIELRKQNCGPSDYAIYEMPSSSCSPPTARPGLSEHERGLAIDFTQGGSTLSSSDSGYSWLQSNAAGYGLYNLPSETWHWSTSGT
jgi:hypothetical protein